MLRLTGNVNLSEEGIEVVFCHLGDEDNVSHQMNVIGALKDAGKVILSIGLQPSFYDLEERLASIDRANQLSKVSDGFILLRKGDFIEGDETPEDVDAKIALQIGDIKRGLKDILRDGIINIDSECVREILENCGTFMVSRGVGTGINRVESAIQRAFATPLYSDFDMSTAKALIIKVLIPKQDTLSGEEMKRLQQLISYLSESKEVIFGLGSCEAEENQVEIVMLGAGLYKVKDGCESFTEHFKLL